MHVASIDISANIFEKCRFLSSVFGDRGSLWIAKHKPSDTRYVIKIYDLEKCNEEWKLIQDEITFVKKLNHRNIISYAASFIYDQQLWLVMPLIGYMSASRLLMKHFSDGLSEAALLLIIKDVLHGLHYLHLNGIIHRSIKGSHILVDINGRCLLSGFRHSVNTVTSGKWEKILHAYPEEAAFNLNWASPELLKQDLEGYSEKTDIYSLGITVCELGNGEVPYCKFEPQLMLVEKIYGREPFLYDENTCRYMSENMKDSGVGGSYGDYLSSLPKMDKYFSNVAHEFVALCLTFDSNLRPSAERLIRHPFIKQARHIDVSLPQLLDPITPIREDTDLGDNEIDPLERSIEKMHIDDNDEITWDL